MTLKLNKIIVKKNKKILSITTILIIIIISSCTTITKKRAEDLDIRIGLTGLAIEFIKNTPPAKVFEGDILPVMIRIKNNGAYSIKDNQAIFSLGVEKDYTKKIELLRGGRVQAFARLENAASFSLEGRSGINLVGGEEVIIYNVFTGKVDPQSEMHISTVVATLCYPYETILASNVCIDTDVNNLKPAKKVCNVQDLNFNNGQGAPVAVTKVEVSMLPMQAEQNDISQKIIPQFLIYVENRGQGTVIKSEAVNDFCTKSETEHENLNIVYLDVDLSSTKLECQLEKKEGSDELGHIKLKDKKDIIRCAVKEGIKSSQDPYLSPLKIVLKYGYTQSISANYLIQKTAR